jgi:UPF0176 protein
VKASLNISAYLFVTLEDTAALSQSIRSQASSRALRGTVLLAEEGINLVLAGSPEPLRSFMDWLRTDARLRALEAKESWSDRMPFGKLVVKVKREIIRMNHPGIRPDIARARSVDARTVSRWLDAGHDDDGRPVVVLDARNAFEVAQGRLRGAIDLKLRKFSDFPEAALRNIDQLRGKTVVSYCTGGIRCEKAAIFMAEAGLENVWQLDGGILKYLQETGGKHYDGECFVFDDRIALDADLAEVTPL